MAAPDAAQVADGINPFARFGAVWAACITPAGRKLVLLALTDFADADGTNIRPAVATVAARCNISAKQARRHIHDLVELGVIKTTRVAAQHRAATYALDFAALSALPQAGALENASTPMGVPQTSHGCPSDLPPMGDDPGYYPGDNQGNNRGVAPSWSGLAPGPSGAWPDQVDTALAQKWEIRCRWVAAERVVIFERATELDGLGHDINTLIQQALDMGWRRWPLPPKSKASHKRARRGERAPLAFEIPTGTPEQQEAAYLGVTP